MPNPPQSMLIARDRTKAGVRTMSIRMRLVTGCAALLSPWTMSCGHAHNATPPMAAAVNKESSTQAARPAALQQTGPKEPLTTEADKEREEEPQAPLQAPSQLTAAEAPPPGAATIQSFMFEHFTITTWARDSIVNGNLETIRIPLRALSEYGYKSVAPGGWMKGIAQLQAAARLTAQAQTLEMAAIGIATMGRICGQCHREQGGPEMARYKLEKTTPLSDRLNSRMFRHAWAVDRMWDGLTAPSDDAWQSGADALAHAPVAAPEATPALPQAVVQTLRTIRQLGVRASSADSAEQRAAVYGELLYTCAECHRHDPELEP